MKKAYIVLGMKRSGHHAIVYWIGHNYPSAMTFNDCIYDRNNRRLIHRLRPVSQTLAMGNAKKNGKSPIHIFNMEDFNMPNFDKHDFANMTMLNNYDKVYWILAMRDPYNWIASSFQTGAGSKHRIIERIALYKKQALHFDTDPRFIPVNFNSWVSSIEYRKGLAKLLDMPSHEKGVDEVSPRGGGSSFDKMKYAHKAGKMDVLERWRKFEKDEWYLKVINDHALTKIDADHFGIRAKEIIDGKE